MRVLIAALAVVAAIWGLLYRHPAQSGEPFDVAMVLGIGIGSIMACAVMLRGTRVWTIRNTGMFLVLAGDALLYTPAGLYRLFDWPQQEGVTDLARASFMVGVPLFIVGMAWWLMQDRGE